MGKIDIFSIEPTKLCTDLSGRFIEIYGQEKSGKTSTAVMWEKPLLCAFEIGYNALVGVKPAVIDTWGTFKDICRQLKNPSAHDVYATIIIDTTTIAYSMCEDYIKAREGVDKISDIPYGGGYKMVREEFQKTFLELSKLKYGIVFLTHAKTRKTSVLDPHDGQPIEQVCPNLNNAAAEAVNGLVDIIAYINVEYDEDMNASRWLYLRQTPYIFAGSRYANIKPKIPLDYQTLVDTVAEAMRDEAKRTGTSVITEKEKDAIDAFSTPVIRSYNDILAEAKEQWIAYMEKSKDAADEQARSKTLESIVTEVFGYKIRLSETNPDQIDFVAQVLDRIKSL